MSSFLADHQKTLARMASRGADYGLKNAGDSDAASGFDGLNTNRPTRKLVLPENIRDLQRLITLSQFDPRIRQQLLNTFRSGSAPQADLKLIIAGLAKSQNSAATDILGEILNIVPGNLRQQFTRIISAINKFQAEMLLHGNNTEQTDAENWKRPRLMPPGCHF